MTSKGDRLYIKPLSGWVKDRRKEFGVLKEWYKRNGNTLHYKFPIQKPR